jgi:hypothetical protein
VVYDVAGGALLTGGGEEAVKASVKYYPATTWVSFPERGQFPLAYPLSPLCADGVNNIPPQS